MQLLLAELQEHVQALAGQQEAEQHPRHVLATAMVAALASCQQEAEQHARHVQLLLLSQFDAFVLATASVAALA